MHGLVHVGLSMLVSICLAIVLFALSDYLQLLWLRLEALRRHESDQFFGIIAEHFVEIFVETEI